MWPRAPAACCALLLLLVLGVQGETCDKNLCHNGGTCFSGKGKEPFCICADGFTGTYCNVTENGPCQPNPCHNRGECQVLSYTRRGDTFAQYLCKCLPGYDGEHCEIDKNYCSTRPCKNGGICSHRDDDYSCQCASPYIGKSCQIRCANALGMEGGAITDAQITSSSLYYSFLAIQRWGPNLARLNNKCLVNAWTASSYDQHPWIQVNMLRQMRVSAIITQGASRVGKAEYLKEFKVAYSIDGHEFVFYEGEGRGKEKVFRGNVDNDGRKANIFSPPITAQYIRVYPVTCHRACTLRFELFGCEMSDCDAGCYEDRNGGWHWTPVYLNTVGCSEPLGMKSRLIPDKQITASSVFKTWGIDAFTWHPHFARLDKGGKSNAWTALENTQSEWLQVDLGFLKKITGIVTQGAKDFGNIQYVESFKVAYSNDGSTWVIYPDKRLKQDKVFLGNSDNYSHKRNLFNPPISARYVRVLPQSWHERITLRMELLGCDD